MVPPHNDQVISGKGSCKMATTDNQRCRNAAATHDDGLTQARENAPAAPRAIRPGQREARQRGLVLRKVA